MLHSIWILFLSSLHTISAASVFVWFYGTCWLVFIFCGMKDVWTFGLIFSAFYPFLNWALLGKNSHLLAEPMFSFSVSVRLLAIDLAISLHHVCYRFTFPFISCYTWTCGLMFLPCQPISLSIFCLRLSRPTFHIFTSFGICWPTFLLCQPISLLHYSSFLGPFTSSLPLLLPRAFY